MSEHPRPVALITGGAQRLGAASARALHQRGVDLLIHYRHSRTAAEQLADELNRQRADSVHLLCADLCEIDQVERLARQACAHYGRLDLLLNNASSFYPTPMGQADATAWRELVGSNMQAPFFLSQACTPTLAAGAGGCIINMVDIHAEKPLAGHVLYCMAKAALVMMTRSLAVELAPQVRVNGIAPGAILWPEQSPPDHAAQQRIIEGIPLGRVGSPEDIARTIVFLALDAPYITGQIVAVDGGRSQR